MAFKEIPFPVMKDIKIPIPNTENEQIPVPNLSLSSHFVLHRCCLVIKPQMTYTRVSYSFWILCGLIRLEFALTISETSLRLDRAY